MDPPKDPDEVRIIAIGLAETLAALWRVDTGWPLSDVFTDEQADLLRQACPEEFED